MKKALVLLAEGFEEIEACTIIDVLRRCDVHVVTAGLTPNPILGGHGVSIAADKGVDEVSSEDFDAVICPGGAPGFQNLRSDNRVLNLVRSAFQKGKLIAAICGAPVVLSDAGVLVGKECTIYPGMEKELEKGRGIPKKDSVVIDGNIITSRGPATAFQFTLTLSEKLAGKERRKQVAEATLADLYIKM
ncbi:MAG: DJ-1/PfpI family protein [Candidatus Bathyarchaeota archaeon]|nr:MAG: DJ-1/PfpI family protein [Candidatus Bathyarchaeota archaeon]